MCLPATCLVQRGVNDEDRTKLPERVDDEKREDKDMKED
jgi:hypothetical protein